MGSGSSKSYRRSKYRAELPSSSYGNIQQPARKHLPTGLRICAGCDTKIGHGKKYKSSLNAFWHSECFCCKECDETISDYEFIPCGSYAFHKSCHGHKPMCDVCKDFIEEPCTSGDVGHPFWKQDVCPSHEHDGTPKCFCCKRMMPQDTKIFNLEEDRNLCLECLDTAIMDTNQAQSLYIEIQRFYQGLDMELDQQIPLMRLVGKQEMHEALRDDDENATLGLFQEGTYPWVEAKILVLFGLPRLQIGTTIAHEMMHAWMAQKGYPTLDRVVKEGICEVMANMWLEDELSSLSSSNSMSPYNKRKLGEFIKYQFESKTTHDVYVDGFRQGQQAVRKYGLKRTLKHIRKTQNFPS